MAQFLALTSRGLQEALEKELITLDFKVLGRHQGGVSFESSWADIYRAHLKSRLATRFLLPVLDFYAYQPEELYGQVKNHDFTKYISPQQTIAIDASVRESKFQDQRYVGMKIKDAIVDQFRDKFGVRPDVERDNPDLRIQVRVVRNLVSISIDLSGDTLSHRGYRKEAGEAPLAEHIASALVNWADWNPSIPLVDMMCGSGTIGIEAALKGKNIAPGTLRRGFGFQKLKNFNAEVWEKCLQDVIDQETPDMPLKIWCSDKMGSMVKIAKDNAMRAGVDEDIQFESISMAEMKNPFPDQKGIIIMNPPYGERMEDPFVLEDLYKDMAFILKNQFKGWTCYILSGNRDLTQFLKLKASQKYPVFNGPIECRLLKYEIT